MASKMTRRAVLGTVIAGLAAGPFVMRALRKPKQFDLGENSELRKFREKYQTALDFPRTFDPFSGNNVIPGEEREGFLTMMLPLFLAQPKEWREKALKIHNRYWANYARLDEVEFDCTSYSFDRQGRKNLDNNFSICAHVWLKYGYGMEIKGTNVKGDPIHWVFNMDGEVTLPTAQEMNLSSMFRSFFAINSAIPEWVVFYGEVIENVPLQENPHIVSSDRYDRVTMLRRPNLPKKLHEYDYSRTYYNRATGMPELVVSAALDSEDEKAFLEGTLEKPRQNFWYEVSRYSRIQGVYVPIELTHFFGTHQGEKPAMQDTYSNIKVRLLKT